MTTAEQVEERERQQVADRGPVKVLALRATIWEGSNRQKFEALRDSEAIGKLEGALRANRPLWLELRLDRDPDRWFEGGLTPWSDRERPELDWSEVRDLREAVIEATPFSEERFRDVARRVFEVLPHAYALGVERASIEAFGFAGLPTGFEIFPTVGFRPVAQDAVLPELHVIRMAVARAGKLVVTVRLPDIPLRAGETPNGLAPEPLDVPKRYFPHATQPNGQGVVGAIARHQAATARVVSERMRESLADVRGLAFAQPDEKKMPDTTADWIRAVLGLVGDLFRKPSKKDDDPPLAARDAPGQLWQMGELVQEVDRQVARLLRRFGSAGDDASHPLAERKLRYRYALHEVRALQSDIRLDRDAVANEFAAGEQRERERFQFVAAALGGIILVPTLIAALYGANVKFPGKDTPGGFIALALAILAFAGAGWIAISEFWVRGWVPQSRQRSRRTQVWAIVLLAVGAVVATVLAAVGIAD